MHRPSVSVIIPTFNSAALVAEAVESALAQTAPPAQVLVIDDGSADDTAQRLLRFGDRVRYVRQENQGVSAARNHGIRMAAGEVVAFLDADDFWHPRKLELQLDALAARPDLGLLGTGVFDWPGALPDVAAAAGEAPRDVPWPWLAVKNYFTTSSVVVRRSVLERAGEFDTSL